MFNNKIMFQECLFLDKFKGVKEIRIFNKKISAYSIPENRLKTVVNSLSSDNDSFFLKSINSGIYFLINDIDSSIYVGKSKELIIRINRHFDNQKKFNRALLIYSADNEFNEMVIDYLEWYFINEIINNDYGYELTNSDKRSKKPQNLSSWDEEIILNIIPDIKNILLLNNINLYEEKFNNKNINFENEINPNIAYENIENENEVDENQFNEINIFYFKDSKLFVKNNKYFLLKGSKLQKNIEMPSINVNSNDRLSIDRKIWWDTYNKKILEWLNEGFISNNNDCYILLDNIEFNSPSGAARFAKCYHSVNGWDVWKNKDGKTLDEIYRKNK